MRKKIKEIEGPTAQFGLYVTLRDFLLQSSFVHGQSPSSSDLLLLSVFLTPVFSLGSFSLRPLAFVPRLNETLLFRFL